MPAAVAGHVAAVGGHAAAVAGHAGAVVAAAIGGHAAAVALLPKPAPQTGRDRSEPTGAGGTRPAS